MNVKSLGNHLYLDSGTLTPLLKKLESQGHIIRTRSQTDERNLAVSLTEKGVSLKHLAAAIPEKIKGCVNLNHEDALTLYKLL